MTAYDFDHPSGTHRPELALVSDGVNWTGTFGVLVKALFTDLLLDQEPVTALIELDAEPSCRLVAQVVAVVRNQLRLSDDSYLVIEDVTGVWLR